MKNRHGVEYSYVKYDDNLYRTPHNLYTLYGIRFDQVDLDDCTTLSRELYDWILVRMSRND